MILNTLNSLLQFFTQWPPAQLLLAVVITLVTYLLMELVLGILIRRKGNPVHNKKVVFPSGLLKIIRSGFRFLIPYLFLIVIQAPDKPPFPWNLAFEAPVLLLLFAGILSILFKGISVLEKQKFSDYSQNSVKRQMIIISRRGVKTSLSLIFLSLFFWRILEQFPHRIRSSVSVTVLIILNAVLMVTVLFLVVRQFFSAAESFLEQRSGHHGLTILLDSLSVPLRILILALALVWMKTLVPHVPTALLLLSQFSRFLFLTGVIVFIYRALEFFGARVSRYSDEDTNTLDKTLVEMFRMIFRILIITAGVFIAIRIFTGKPLTTLLAGLGIGGLAVALAAQDTLKNFFGSIMIMWDKPFKIGERIVTDGFDGVIENIGFRSTRMRTLTGHQVIIPNDKMAMASIENIGRRPNIRRLLNITVTYDTSPEKMEKALEIIRGILANHEGMPEDLPPRVHFSEFNPDSLNILVLYWYEPPDYWKFMEFSEKVNLSIMGEFNREGIKFAFPSTTTYLEQSEGKSLRLDMGSGWKADGNNLDGTD